MLFIICKICKYKYRKYRKPRQQMKRTHFPWNLSMLLALFALTLQHKPKFYGHRRRHLWKLWHSNICIMTIMTVRYRIFLDCRHFPRPLSQLLDFLPQGYPEVSPSESIQIRMLFIVCKYKYRKYRKPRHQIKRTHFPWNLSMLLARFALTPQHKPKFHGNGRRHLWKLWRSNNCNHDNHDSEIPYLLGLTSFSQRPLSRLLDFLPQGYPEVSPSECICMLWSEATLKPKQNMFLAFPCMFGTAKLFLLTPALPTWKKTVCFAYCTVTSCSVALNIHTSC